MQGSCNKIILASILFFAPKISFTQTKIQQIDSLSKLGKDSLIKLALKKINDPAFNQNDYKNIKVIVKKDNVTVSFRNNILLIKNNSCFYSHVSVELLGGGVSKSIEGNCDNPNYYKLTKKDKEKIDFVFNCINKSNEVGDIPDKKLEGNTTMVITEKLGYYEVEVSDYSTMSRYKINKQTGKIYDAMHKHYAHSDDETEEIEITK